LVELLVVIAIIGVLVGLLLPAVQAAREAARRMSCGNNIRQIALAATNYEAAFKTLPLNYATIDPSAAQYNNQASWLTMILPNLEQNPIYQNFNFSLAPLAPNNLAGASKTINLYRCPSDTTPREAVGSRLGTITLNPKLLIPAQAGAVTSYLGCAGSNWELSTPSQSNPTDTVNYNTTGTEFSFDPFLVNNGNAHGNGNGIFFPGYLGKKGFGNTEPWGRPCLTNIASIKDGLSNTFMVGESVGSFTSFNWWYWHEGSTATCAIRPNAGPRCPEAANKPKRLGLISCSYDLGNNYGFMSEHGSGLQFALADGSVKFIADAIDETTYRRMGSMMDGGIVNVPD
jgi:type II secretory pathway pseudopilin PulG